MDDDDTDNHPRAQDHAVVIGAGLAGLLAARVLADRFAQVTLVERDELPEDGPAFRPGVPQSRHAHVLWSRGLELLEELLPGTTDELLGGGAALLKSPGDFLWLSPADWFRAVPGTEVLLAGRELIDWTVRRAVLRHERIRLRAGAAVTGLTAAPDGRAVTGVQLRHGDPLDARFVVDATGRGSKTPAWLAALGVPAPEVTRYDSKLGYSSRYFEIPPDPARRWHGMYVQGRPDSPRGAVLMPVDRARWLVTLIGNGEHAPPTRDEEFLGFARSLRSPALHDAIRDAKPLSPAVGYRATANEWLHYERLERWPAGFVVLGDAACRFNPVYGHGMTVAALAADALRKEIRALDTGSVPGAARRIQRRTVAAAQTAWQIATSEDMRYPQTQGPPPDRTTRILQRYMARVMVGANTDPAVSGRFFGVLSLSTPPSALLTPATMIRVLSKWRVPASPATADYPPHHVPPAGYGR
ncbi:NAD(P)/FAD-dependent oxidoreductase [Streptomyces xanthophaeus]|uniref:NAD(P)/FAD-dependent oxidoreductase n=1 Tax=Streptomyces xanthophaeus TaxID=67385 RepID=UPI003654B8CC